MKQTAVEFFSKGLFDILQEAEDNNILEVGTQNFKRYIEMFEKQAKEMEEQQQGYSEEEAMEFFIEGYKQRAEKSDLIFDNASRMYAIALFKQFKNK